MSATAYDLSGFVETDVFGDCCTECKASLDDCDCRWAMPRRPLTPRQKDALNFIIEHATEKGYPPSFREIAIKLGVVSTNSVMGHIRQLQANGYLARGGPGKGRALTVLAVPQ